jgi:hypothetical protein
MNSRNRSPLRLGGLLFAAGFVPLFTYDLLVRALPPLVASAVVQGSAAVWILPRAQETFAIVVRTALLVLFVRTVLEVLLGDGTLPLATAACALVGMALTLAAVAVVAARPAHERSRRAPLRRVLATLRATSRPAA